MKGIGSVVDRQVVSFPVKYEGTACDPICTATHYGSEVRRCTVLAAPARSKSSLQVKFPNRLTLTLSQNKLV